MESAGRGGTHKAIERFVADVKQRGLTAGHAELVIRFSDMLEGSGDSKFASKAINELLPAFRASMNHRPAHGNAAGRHDRRLPGNKLELEGTLFDGSKLDWESYRGKVVLVDFFASWCGPCRAEVPNVLENYAAYHGQRFRSLGINLDQDRAGLEAYVQQTGFKFPTLFSDDPTPPVGTIPWAASTASPRSREQSSSTRTASSSAPKPAGPSSVPIGATARTRRQFNESAGSSMPFPLCPTTGRSGSPR